MDNLCFLLVGEKCWKYVKTSLAGNVKWEGKQALLASVLLLAIVNCLSNLCSRPSKPLHVCSGQTCVEEFRWALQIWKALAILGGLCCPEEANK